MWTTEKQNDFFYRQNVETFINKYISFFIKGNREEKF